MEITQFTYFQQLGGFDLDPITIELTYGLERIAMYLQGVDSMYDIVWSRWTEPDGDRAGRHLRRRLPARTSASSRATTSRSPTPTCCSATSREFEAEAERCLEARLPIPAYDYVLKCSHAFNLLDARGVISVTDRTAHIASVRDLARKVAAQYLEVVAGAAGDADVTVRMTRERHVSAAWLFEIGAEELPYKTCQSVLAQLRGRGSAEAPGLVYETLLGERLVGDGDAVDAVAFAETRLKVMVAPRRIAVFVNDVPREQTAQTQRFRGPRADVAFGPDGAPTKAGEGFARGKGLTPDRLQRETADGNEFVVAVAEAERHAAERVLPERLPAPHRRAADPARHALGRAAGGRRRVPALLAALALAGLHASPASRCPSTSTTCAPVQSPRATACSAGR